MTNKHKFVHGRCSKACSNWICCQDCERKQWCKNHCKQSLNTNICKHFKKEAIEKAFKWMLTAKGGKHDN